MARQSANSQSSILDDIGGFFSKLWHGITSFFSSIFGGDKASTSATSSDDDPQAENSSVRPTSSRGMRRSRRPDFTRAASNNSSMFPGANSMSFASASNGDYFSQVSRVSSRFNGNAFGFGGRECFAPAFAHHGGGFQGGGMRFHGGGGMHCGGGRRH